MLIVMSMILPLVQLVVLGYAFGGNVKHLKLAIVDQDHGVPAVKIRELARRRRLRRAHHRHRRLRRSRGRRSTDLRNGRVNGVLTIPPDFSRRVLAQNEPRVALIEDNTDNFVSVALAGTLGGMVGGLQRSRRTAPRVAGAADARRRRGLSRTCPTSSTCCRDRS